MNSPLKNSTRHPPFMARAILLLGLALLAWVGCAAQTAPPSVPPQEVFIHGDISAVYPGPLDSRNRYLSNVAIQTEAKRLDGSEHCSGILLSPRDILTAGHCVCLKRQLTTSTLRDDVLRRLNESLPSSGRSAPERTAIEDFKARVLANTHTLIDASLCASQVKVSIVEYQPRKANAASSFLQTEYIGKVIHPHPRLLVIDDATGVSWFREADLAMIHLPEPVSERFRSIKIPEREVEVGNPIIMVGHGFGENGGTTKEFGARHYGESVIETVERLPSGSVKFIARQPAQGDKPSPRVYGGDSGGGGFSKTDDHMLVGVISAFGKDGHGGSSIFTSVFAYKSWLSQELAHKGAAAPPP